MTPTRKTNSMPAAKLRSQNSFGLTNGAFTVRVCTRNSQKADPLTTASISISREPNQSSSSPRSSRICNAPIAMLNVAKPNQSSRAFVRFVSGRKKHMPEKCQNADRHIDVKIPSPTVIVGQPSAENWPDDRANHDGHAPIGHGRALLLLRVGVQQHRLRQRHQGRAKTALDQPEQDELVQRIRQSACHRGERETDHRGLEQTLDAKSVGEIAGRRRHDRCRNDVGGQTPTRSRPGWPRHCLGCRAARRWRLSCLALA